MTDVTSVRAILDHTYQKGPNILTGSVLPDKLTKFIGGKIFRIKSVLMYLLTFLAESHSFKSTYNAEP